MKTSKDNAAVKKRRLFATGYSDRKGGWKYVRYAHALALVLVACGACDAPSATGPAGKDRPNYAVTVGSFPAADGSPLSYERYPSTVAIPAGQLRAAVIWVSGGGWQDVGVNSDVSRWWIPRLPKKGPWDVFVPRYRVGQGIWPAQEHDVRCFIAYLRYNAATLGIDPNHMFAIGHSAGGHIVARIIRDMEPALTCQQGVSSSVRAGVTISAAADVWKLSGFNADAAAFIPKVFQPGDSTALWNADPVRVGGPCAPLQILAGKKDASVSYSNSVSLQAACAPWGAKLKLYDIGTHSLLQDDVKQDAIAMAVAHLTANLH